jgi:hypothetical protein
MRTACLNTEVRVQLRDERLAFGDIRPKHRVEELAEAIREA